MSNVMRAFAKFQHVKSKSQLSSFSRCATGESAFVEEPPRAEAPARSLKRITTRVASALSALQSAKDDGKAAKRSMSRSSLQGRSFAEEGFESAADCKARMKEVLAESGVDGLHTELVLKLNALRSRSLEGEVAPDISWLRDVLLKQVWDMVNGEVAGHRQSAADARKKVDEIRRQQREMQASHLRETTSLRDQIRRVPTGMRDAVDVSFSEPMKYLDQETRELVQACVEERIKHIFAKQSDILNDPTVQGAMQVKIAERCGHLEKRLSDSESCRADLEQARAQLESDVRELRGKLDAVVAAHATIRAECAEHEEMVGLVSKDLTKANEDLQKANEELRARPHVVEIIQEQAVQAPPAAPAAPAAETATQPDAAAKKTLEDAALQMRAACLNATMATELPHDGGDAAPDSEAWSLLQGASSGVLLAHATEVKDKVEAKASAPACLLGVLEKLVRQLDAEVLGDVANACCDDFWENLTPKMLPMRIGVMRHESATVWQLLIFLAHSLRKLGETSDAKMTAQLKLRTLAQQLSDAASTSESMSIRCFQAMQKCWIDVEESRKQLQLPAARLGSIPTPLAASRKGASSDSINAPDSPQAAPQKRAPPVTASKSDGAAAADGERRHDDAQPAGVLFAPDNGVTVAGKRRASGPTKYSTPKQSFDPASVVPASPNYKLAAPKSARSADKGSLVTVAKAVTQHSKPMCSAGAPARNTG